MDKIILENLIEQGLSSYQIAETLNKSQTTTRYWLSKYGLKTKLLSRREGQSIYDDPNTIKHCPRCNTSKSISMFYNRRNGKGCSPYCKSCSSIQAIERQRAFKSKCIEYKGGSCVICGYNKTQAALDFHHLDPSQKDFHISEMKSYRFDDTIKLELDKCNLVCSNCHREIHEQLVNNNLNL